MGDSRRRAQALLSCVLFAANGCSAEGGEAPADHPADSSVTDAASESATEAVADTFADSSADSAAADASSSDADATPDTPPTTLDLHDVTLFDNPTDLADWPVTTTITEVDFQTGSSEGVHVQFSKRDGDGSWPDITPPGWTGPLEYTLGFAEYIEGKWYGSAAIQFWRGLDASGGNVAADVGTMSQCTAFGYASTCQVAKNWYYDGRWGKLAGRQPATGELIGVFVVAGNVRGVTDGSQSPVKERSNVVLVPMPDIGGAKHAF